MVVRCGKCKSSDVEAIYPPTRFEEVLAWVLPLAPYHCDQCQRRFFSWASPLMDRNRTIAAGVLVGLIALAVILVVIGEPDPPVAVAKAKITPAQEPLVAELKPAPADPLPSTEQATPEVPTEAPAAEASLTSTNPAEPAGAAAIASPPPQLEEQPLPTALPADGRFSASVLKRLQENQARDRGQPTEHATKPLAVPAADQLNTSKPTQSAPTQANNTSSLKTSAPAETLLTKQSKVSPAVTAKPAVEAALKPARLDDVRIEIKGDELEIHLVCSGPLMPERGSTQKAFFVDLLGNWTISRKLSDRMLDHPLVTGIRLGRHPDRLRVALDLRDKPIDATFKIEDSGLLLRVTPKQ